MSLYIPTYEECKVAKELRMDIIEMLMEIKDPKILGYVKAVANKFAKDEFKRNPMSLDEFVDYLDFPMVVRLKDLFKDEEPWTTTKKQIDELCTRAIESYTGGDHCE